MPPLAASTCGTLPGFTLLGSAGAYSGLTGVLAGVLFTGVVLLVGFERSNPSPPNREDRQAALVLMIPAFLLLVIASFTFGIIGGEEICRRLDLESEVASILFAAGGTATFQAIAWMMHSLEATDAALRWISSTCQLVITLMVVSQIVVLNDDFRADYAGTSFYGLANYVLGAAGAVAVIAAWTFGNLRPNRVARRAAQTAAWALVLTLLASVAIFEAGIFPSRKTWEGPDTAPFWVVLAATALTLVGYSALAVVAWAAPPLRRQRPSDTFASLPNSSGR